MAAVTRATTAMLLWYQQLVDCGSVTQQSHVAASLCRAWSISVQCSYSWPI